MDLKENNNTGVHTESGNEGGPSQHSQPPACTGPATGTFVTIPHPATDAHAFSEHYPHHYHSYIYRVQ